MLWCAGRRLIPGTYPRAPSRADTCADAPRRRRAQKRAQAGIHAHARAHTRTRARVCADANARVRDRMRGRASASAGLGSATVVAHAWRLPDRATPQRGTNSEQCSLSFLPIISSMRFWEASRTESAKARLVGPAPSRSQRQRASQARRP